MHHRHHMDRWRRGALLLTAAAVAGATLVAPPQQLAASSHMDAPMITLDDAANLTDVYAFVSQRGEDKFLTTALSVNPFEKPGVGPNVYRFDDDVLYSIHVALGDDVQKGQSTLTYEFLFKTVFADDNTILQAFRDGDAGPVIRSIGDSAQNMRQSYSVTEIDRRKARRKQKRQLGTGQVPPNNQGRVTPAYNDSGVGDNPAKPGVSDAANLDDFTKQAIASLQSGFFSFAGQRDDAFYADVNSIFDGLNIRTPNDPAADSQKGFNVHTIVLDIPIAELGGDQQQVGIFATTSRRKVTKRSKKGNDKSTGKWVQVSRLANPLFNEAFVALKDKALYNRSPPSKDKQQFETYALEPELAKLVNQVLFGGQTVAEETGRTDLAAIYIPDVIKVDLSTPAARLAGGGTSDEFPANPDDPGFSRLSIFGPGEGDVLDSALTGGKVPGGWPNGRRFGDDVVDIAVIALALSPPGGPIAHFPNEGTGIDLVTKNDAVFNKVFPYAATPHNGRNHKHDDPGSDD